MIKTINIEEIAIGLHGNYNTNLQSGSTDITGATAR